MEATSSRGSAGGNGTGGFDGGPGFPGSNSQHASIYLGGTVDNLDMQLRTYQTLNYIYNQSSGIDWNQAQLSGHMNYNFQMHNSNGIILVKAVGGNGGDGGKGGDGGDGGRGGEGARGTDGVNGANGQNGGHGSNGGDGGPGGNGGYGGNAGDGGDSGAGGHVQVRSTDPRLFMLIGMDCRAGKKGHGGQGGGGGVGGPGGAGGSGGRGGRGGEGGPSGSKGTDGNRGSDGAKGSNGFNGNNGSDGRDGRVASHGSIQYAVVDLGGNVLEMGPDRYNASVCGYTLADENNDGIYEPNSDFFITDVEWTNNGAMTLPGGCLLSFQSGKHVEHDMDDASVLPGIRINQVFSDAHQFKFHLNAPNTVTINQPYTKTIKVTSTIKLFNRVFDGSEVSSSFTCQYPIQIIKTEVAAFLGPSERTTVTVVFKNISTRSYGTCSNSAGSIKCVLLTHPLVKILPAIGNDLYEIRSDGSAHFPIDEEIAAQATKHIRFNIGLESAAAYQYYEHLSWNVDFFLRDVMIEQHQNTIRVVPTFQPNIHTDVLLVTNSQVGREEFLAYLNLFQLFQFSSQSWDIERYGAFHNAQVTWLNTTDLIIFIYSNPESTFKAIKSEMLLQHMRSSENTGFICVGAALPNDFDFCLFDYNTLQFIDTKEQTKALATNHLWSGIGFSQPSRAELNAKANTLRTEHEKQDDHRFLYQTVYDNTLNNHASGCLTVVYGAKYMYKSTLDFQVGHRLILVNSHNALLTGSNSPFTSQRNGPTEINLNSLSGRLLCAILCYLGFTKSQLIASNNTELARSTYSTGSRLLNFNQILASLAMSIIEREYDRQSLIFRSSEELVSQIANIIGKEDNHGKDRGIDKNDWFYLLVQCLYGYIDSKFWRAFPWCGCTAKAKQLNRLRQILSDLLSLTTNEIPKDEDIQREVPTYRLQRLANLNFPAADRREVCARPIEEIRTWQLEQSVADTSPRAAMFGKY